MASKQLIFTAIAVILLASHASGYSMIHFAVNPDTKVTRDTIIHHPTCPATVTSRGSAFMCFKDNGNSNYVQFVNPTQPKIAYHEGVVKTPPSGVFQQSPIPLSKYTAIVDTANADYSYWAVASSVQVFHQHDRYGSTAKVAYNPDDEIAYIPFGSTPMSFGDSIKALDVTKVQDKVLWDQFFPFPKGFKGSSLLGSPTYYDGAVFVMQENTLFKLDANKAPANKSQILWQISDPCGIKPLAGSQIQLHVVTYSKDHNGNLDALILTAPVAGQDKNGVTMCRISHHSGLAEWSTPVTFDNYELHHVSAGGGFILISGGILNTASSYSISIIDAKTGDTAFTIERSAEDKDSFPLVLQQEVRGCKGNGTLVAQQHGKLTAFCLTKEHSLKKAWVSKGACNAQPTSVITKDKDGQDVEYIACIEYEKSVHMVDSRNGIVLWTESIPVLFAPSFVDGYVWATAKGAWLYGLTPVRIPSPNPPQKGSPSHHRLSAGIIVLILFICAFVIGGAGFAFAWTKRSRRRSGYKAEADENGYGSLTS